MRRREALAIALAVLLAPPLAVGASHVRYEESVARFEVVATPAVSLAAGTSQATTVGANATSAATVAAATNANRTYDHVLRIAPAPGKLYEVSLRIKNVTASVNMKWMAVQIVPSTGGPAVTQIAIKNGAITRESGPAVLQPGGAYAKVVLQEDMTGRKGVATLPLEIHLRPAGGSGASVIYAYAITLR